MPIPSHVDIGVFVSQRARVGKPSPSCRFRSFRRAGVGKPSPSCHVRIFWRAGVGKPFSSRRVHIFRHVVMGKHFGVENPSPSRRRSLFSTCRNGETLLATSISFSSMCQGGFPISTRLVHIFDIYNTVPFRLIHQSRVTPDFGWPRK